jgi:predicted nucleic acid-binding protein
VPRRKPAPGYTLDTGALIALERHKKHVVEMIRRAIDESTPMHIPMAVVAEFWRGPQPRELAALVERFSVPDTLHRAKRAGVALGRIPKQPRGRGPGPIDALVAALASDMGDAVITADPDDIEMLKEHFPGIAGIVRV